LKSFNIQHFYWYGTLTAFSLFAEPHEVTQKGLFYAKWSETSSFPILSYAWKTAIATGV